MATRNVGQYAPPAAATVTIDVDDVGAGDAAGLKVTLVGVAG